MQEKVYQALCKSTGEPHPALLVAVSGGKDSMALLHAVGFGAKKRGCKVRALHINRAAAGKQAGSDDGAKRMQSLENSVDDCKRGRTGTPKAKRKRRNGRAQTAL